MVSDRTLLRIVRSESAVALIGDLVRAILTVAIIGVIGWYVAYHVALARVMFSKLHMNDFGKFYYSARAFLDGRDMYAPTPATAIPVGEFETRQFANMNPPHFHLLVLALARTEPLTAALVWLTVSLVGFGFSVWLTSRELQMRWTSAGAFWSLAGFLACSATEAMTITGQVTFVMLPAITLAWIGARRARWAATAFWLGILISIKPFLALTGCLLLAKRQYRAIAVMTLTAATCFLIGLAVFGRHAHLSWIDAIGRVDWTWAVMNASLTAPLARALSPNPFFRPLTDASTLVGPLGMAAGALIIAISLISLRRRETGALNVDRGLALLLLASFLASPLGWIYYVWLLLGPLAALAVSGAFNRWPMPRLFIIIAIPGLLYPVQLMLLGQSNAWAPLIPGSLYSVTMVALWAAVLAAERPRHQWP